ncbi:MAG: MMPL family transporter [Candidatus Thiodiazotropha lotti]|nr:MMPL family transporter [Candidatus Thiodiazotropha lotti]MCG8002834.1 MMPL family transporter [Candidatus Thiodiazotropha lotti]MCW4186454.1 MMPL family transporter [Candidatus Thiodiazotropha lotti]MCW4198645.1 MMPL family transporter [Candidatus Thiodiazotropha lotti]
MKRIIIYAAHYPWVVIAVLSVITLVALTRLPDLNIEIAAEGMMVNDSKAMTLYDSTVEIFGSENATVIYLEDKDLVKPDNLAAIQKIVKEIESIPQVSHITSLFSLRYLRTKNGYIFTDPYFKSIPETESSAISIAKAALANPLVERNLISRDGTVMALNLYFDVPEYKTGFDEQMVSKLDAALLPLKKRFRTVFHIGGPSIRAGISEQIRKDQKMILPLALLVLILTLGLMLRHLTAAFIPFLTASLGVIWVLSVMAVLEIPINITTSIIPAILIIAGSTEDIHLISEYQAGLSDGLGALEANHFMAQHMGMAVLLTFITTCLGFLSISLNQIDLLQQFGLVAAIGLTLNFIITVTLVPACLRLITQQGQTVVTLKSAGFDRLALHIFDHISMNPRLFIFAVIMIMAFSSFWATKIEINNDTMGYFEASDKTPYHAKMLQNKLSGVHTLSIVVSGEKEAFLKTHNLLELKKLQGYIEEARQFDKSFSFADYMGVVHGGIDGGQSGQTYLPAVDEQISSYMALLGHASAKSFVSLDYSRARILVRHSISSSKQLNQAIENIRSFASNTIDPRLNIEVTGESYLNSQAVDYMADGQLRSLLLMLVFIFIIITLMLINVRVGLVAVMVNIFPITILFGVMGYFHIALDTGTIMVAAIALGIGVDHTMHFIVRYQRLINEGAPHVKSIMQVIRSESVPIVSTAIALAMGFTTLALSSFPPIALFGLLSAMVMLLALIATFVITPLLLSNPWMDYEPGRSAELITVMRSELRY